MSENLYITIDGMDVREVPCRRCHALVGEHCVDELTKMPLRVPHPERIVEAMRRPRESG